MGSPKRTRLGCRPFGVPTTIIGVSENLLLDESTAVLDEFT